MNPEQLAQLQDQILAQLSLSLSQDKSPINQQILLTITNPKSEVYQTIQKTIQQTVNAATAETNRSLDAHVKASDAHAAAFASHNQDEKAHEKLFIASETRTKGSLLQELTKQNGKFWEQIRDQVLRIDPVKTLTAIKDGLETLPQNTLQAVTQESDALRMDGNQRLKKITASGSTTETPNTQK